jgi:O-succinylbenzoate synthase
MHIDGLTIREIHLRLKAPFETSFGTLLERRVLLVEAHSEGMTGWGEITAGEGPFYNPESVDPAWVIFHEFVAPMVVGKTIDRPSDLPAMLSPLRGYEMTKAAVENALWDLQAQRNNVPLAKLLGGTLDEIACGVSLGIRGTGKELCAAIEKELADGYQRIKIKIKPGKDLEFIVAVRKQFPKIKLMADANSAYRLEDADLLKKFDDYDLMMIEQPLDWDEIYQHAKLQKLLATPICLDECIHNLRHAQAAVELKACRILNIKLGRVGGHTEARLIQDYCRTNSIPVWCGGMLESGIGRAHNIAMSALPGFVLPGDVSASRRYWDEDVIEPEVEITARGTIKVPTTPGIGYRVRHKRIDQLTARKQSFLRKDRSVTVPESAA